jgi:hypothetical protein
MSKMIVEAITNKSTIRNLRSEIQAPVFNLRKSMAFRLRLINVERWKYLV